MIGLEKQMRTSRLAGQGNLYKATTHLARVERELAVILYIAGIEFNQISDVDIDTIFFELRQSFHMSSNSFNQNGHPSYALTRKQNFLLTYKARALWLERTIAKHGVENG